MKRALSLLVLLSLVASLLTSCMLTDLMYGDKTIRVEVTHSSCLESEEPYYEYYDIVEGARYSLPYSDGNIYYSVDFTVTKIGIDGITLSFSRELDLWDSDMNYVGIVSFTGLTLWSELRLVTPTCGGGDSFVFSLVPTSSIPLE